MCRYLTDVVEGLPLSVVARMASTNDTVMALVPLIERPPWRRGCALSCQLACLPCALRVCHHDMQVVAQRRTGKREQQYIEGGWQTVRPANHLKLTQHDAQASS